MIRYVRLKGGYTINEVYLLTGFAPFVMDILPNYGC